MRITQIAPYSEARSALEEALKISEGVYGTQHVNSMRLHLHLGNVLRDMGDFRESRSHLELAYSKGCELLGTDNGETITALNMLMVTCAIKADDPDLLRRLNELLPLVEVSCQTLTRISGDCNPTVLLTIDNYAGAVGVTGDLEKCVTIRRDIVARHERTFGRKDIRTQRMVRNLAIALKESNQYDEARLMLLEFIDFSTGNPEATETEVEDARRTLLDLNVRDVLNPDRMLDALIR